jgi:hypothetical protein
MQPKISGPTFGRTNPKRLAISTGVRTGSVANPKGGNLGGFAFEEKQP